MVDTLLDLRYENLIVLDISGEALERAKERLGAAANRVQWVVSNITEYKPTDPFELWHDWAAFHFLTTTEETNSYLSLVEQSILSGGYLSIATFSDNGPTSCSGLPVHRYSMDELTNQFSRKFKKTPLYRRRPLNPVLHFAKIYFLPISEDIRSSINTLLVKNVTLVSSSF
ncbi:class I SAM-dependent methyltransferase [Dyadobacter psychrotolerans]|uniref:Class I SAM-dependent methyltransferase n=1 Tax=Dyadobacter psychrotolerans TaxID=2541721 RepID=A0A4R5DC69_9BACT|nr:class I SAM-dependent methyltransferase [Dyadobacter psychrotolerans]TDE09411.1 class I SAM-dependent methyltransferase [Dyadobacter psychrotolerans]